MPCPSLARRHDEKAQERKTGIRVDVDEIKIKNKKKTKRLEGDT